MPELSLYNIDQIRNDIRKQEISFSHLLDDLIDHVCCDVEQEMRNGLDFSEAYRRVKQKMGKRRLKEIQEETLYAVDTKYRQMKNTMKISGIAGTVMLGFAALFKILHWPGDGVVMIAGSFTLALIFMPSALGVLWKETHSTKKLLLFISAFLAGMLFIVGVLFKIMNWPGAGIVFTISALSAIFFFVPSLAVNRFSDPENKARRGIYILGAAGLIISILGMLSRILYWPLAPIILMLGMFILLIIVFPWYTWLTWKNESNISVMFVYMVIATIALSTPATMINLNLQRNYSEGYFYHQEEEQVLYAYLQENARSLLDKHHDSQAFPAMEELHARTNDLIKSINDIELKMVALSEGKKGRPVREPVQKIQTEPIQQIDFGLIKDPFSYEPVRACLYPGTEERIKLEKAMEDYRNYITGLDSLHIARNLNLASEPSTYLPSGLEENERITMMTGLHSLTLLKNALLAFESNALAEIADR